MRIRDFLGEHFGGAAEVHANLSHVNNPPSLTAVEKWFQRGSMPAHYFAALLYRLEERYGEPISMRRYVKTGD